MKAVFKHEFSSYFTGLIGYLFIGVLLLFAGIFTWVYNFSNKLANFEYALNDMSLVLLVCVPVLTMRILAEERKQKTDQLLYALPLSMTKIILGKFLAMVALLLIPTAVIGLYPLILTGYGAVHLPAAYGALLAFFLLACALLAMGMFLSSLTGNPVFSAVLCFGALLLLYLMSDLASFVSGTAVGSLAAFAVIGLLLGVLVWRMTKSILPAVVTGAVLEAGLLVTYLIKSSVFEGLFPGLMRSLSPFERYYSFANGVFDVTSTVFYLTVTVLFVLFTVQVMEKRRWSE